ncbi:MAG: CPBP family intramembrane metalloprotease [Candidatus Micrarchaeota archaeon]|nr:CPBP family intramembrane metalloprotease [Candidatus Micrarchaeota archaeon]
MAKRRAPKGRSRARPVPSNARYAFYAITLALIILTAYLSWQYAATQQGDYLYLSSVTLSLLFPSIALSWMGFRGTRPTEIISSLGLSRDRLTRRSIYYALMLFAILIMIEIAIGLFSYATGISLPTNVGMLLNGAPIYFLAFGIIIAPINEEILFRGFLVPRIGIVASALVFAALHGLSYESVSEFAAALAFGLAAGYVFRKTRSLYATIIPHAAINLIGIFALFYMIHV